MSIESRNSKIESLKTTHDSGKAERRFGQHYHDLTPRDIEGDSAESKSAFWVSEYGPDGLRHRTGTIHRKTKEFSKIACIESFREAISDLDESLGRFPGRENNRSIARRKKEHAEFFEDDSVLQLFPDSFSGRNRTLLNVQYALPFQGINTKEELIDVNASELRDGSKIGDKGVEVVKKLQDAAQADLNLREAVDEETYREIIKEQSRRALNPPKPEALEEPDETTPPESETESGEDSSTSHPGEAQQEKPRARYDTSSEARRRRSERSKKKELPKDKWASEDLYKYEKTVYFEGGGPLTETEYPETIELHTNRHKHLNNLRERGLSGRSGFFATGYIAPDRNSKAITGILEHDHKQYSAGHLGEVIRRKAEGRGIKHVVSEAFPDVHNIMRRTFRHLSADSTLLSHDKFPLEQLYRFLGYGDAVRPLYTSYVGRRENLLAFLTAETDYVGSIDEVGYEEFMRRNGFSFHFENIVLSNDHPRSQHVSSVDEDLVRNYLIMNNHNIVIYRGKVDGVLQKLRPIKTQRRLSRS